MAAERDSSLAHLCVVRSKSQMEKQGFDLQLIGAMRLSSQISYATPISLDADKTCGPGSNFSCQSVLIVSLFERYRPDSYFLSELLAT